jgi:hypothetical protein
MRFLVLAALALPAACGGPARESQSPSVDPGRPTGANANSSSAAAANVDPPRAANATVGPPSAVTVAFDPRSPAAAAGVVRRYFALVAAGRRAEAPPLWSDPGAARAFVASTGPAEVGEPGAMEGAAGSSYVEVPLRIAGRAMVATLRRVNDVPGSTPEQRRWRIERIEPAAGR